MNPTDLKNFIEALDTVKKDYTCGVCNKMCKDPVVLKRCFHLICAEHTGLKHCPTCKIPLEDSSTYVDDQLRSSIESAKELDKIFEQFRPKEPIVTSTKKPAKNDSVPASIKSAATLSSAKKPLSDKTNSRPDLSETINSNFSSKFNKNNEKRNNKGETALHIVCRLGKIDKLKELLSLGANTNTKDNAGWTPLHEVVQNGRLDLVKLLLQYNTLIDVPGQGNETPLHEAIRYNHIEIAEELVKHGADMNARNCKGETPYQLASVDVKNRLRLASENILQTQSINISHIAAVYTEIENEDIRLYCVSQYRTLLNKLKVLAKHHSNVHIEAKFTKKVTHLIVDTEDGVCTPSLDVLQGIVSSVWIISSEWATKSTEENLEPFENYEVKGVGTKTYMGPRNSRFNKYKQLPGIFNGCHFYLHNFNTRYEISKTIVLTKAILTKLITDAGGIVLRRAPNPELIPENEKLVPYHAKRDGKLANCSHYIIFKEMYEPMYNMQHLKALPIGWLIECIEKYELCEPW
uniref:BRCT domain-containing protein n=1 Tax=Heliothis virescens TaxID=7102 RepID=A0A2A4J7C5_HELVI